MIGELKMKGRRIKSFREMPRKKITPSELNTFVHICELQHHFRYVLWLKPAFIGPQLGFGSAIDLAWKAFYEAQKEGEVLTIEKATQIFDEKWKSELKNPKLKFDDNDSPEKWAEKGKVILQLMIQGTDRKISTKDREAGFADKAPELEVIDPDFGFVVPPPKNGKGKSVTKREVCGITDLLAADDDTLVIWDCKTSGRAPNEDQLLWDLQATMYSYGITQMYPEAAGRVKFGWQHYIHTKEPKLKLTIQERTEDDFQRLAKLIETFEARLKLNKPMPRREINNWACANCGFQKECDAWHRGDMD